MSNYIVQNMTRYLNMEHFSQIFNNDYTSYFDERKMEPDFGELYNSKYLMLVAEPGYGKTRLFKELVLRANENDVKVFFIDSKQIKSSIKESIEKCKVFEPNISEEKLQKKIYFCNKEDYGLDDKTIVCLDALDELPFANLYSFFEQVEEFIVDNPNVKVFLSCRTHHLKKIEYDFFNIPFEFIILDKFYGKQVFEYLKSKNINEKTIKKIKEKTKLGNLFDFLSIPRFLYYFSELIQNKSVEEIINLSRSEIFEDFIYRKIDKERDRKYPESENHTIKRILEELALVMKIFQVSQISKDDFFTIFKELNLGNIFTGKGLIEKLCDNSLLKDNIDYLEFENQEFLDYLASKELSRFEKIEQVFFDIAVEPHLKEIYTPWFYVMPFVLEQNPNMINIFIDFLEKSSKRILREEYFKILISVDSNFVDEKTRLKIFDLIFDYNMEHNQWIYSYVDKLIYFYDEQEHYQKIIDSISGDVDENNIKIRNVIDLIESLCKKELLKTEKIEFWKEKFLDWLNLDVKEFRNLHRAIVSICAIIMKNDFNWIKKIYFIFEKGIDVQYEYSRTCYKIAPNDKFSIDIYFNCDKQFNKNKIDNISRIDDNVKYISKVDNLDGIRYILEKLTSSDSKEYFDYIFSLSYRNKFQDDLKQFILNIKNNLNSKIIELLKRLLIKIVNLRIRYEQNFKYLFQQIFKILLEQNNTFLFLFIDELYELYKEKKLYYFDFEYIIETELSKYFSEKNFDEIYKRLITFKFEKRNIEDLFIYSLYFNENLDEKVKNKIRKIYKKELQAIKIQRNKSEEKRKRDAKNRQLGLFKQWEYKLEPEPGKFAKDLFEFYINNKEALQEYKEFEDNRKRTIQQAKNVIKFNNPLDGKVEKSGSSSTIWDIYHYKHAIELLHKENIEFTSYEQDLIDNVFRYLPFNINSEYESTLKLAKNPSNKAIQDILDVYSGKRKDDLGIYQPENFLEIYKQKNIKEAEPILLKIFENSEINEYIRKEIIQILPKNILTKNIINEYIELKGKKDVLYKKLLINLIKKFDDKEAIKEAFKIVIKKGKETEIPEHQTSLFGSELELERGYSNELALELTQIDYGIEKDKELLEIALDLRNKNKHLNGYFFEDIVFRHIKYLNHKKTFEPLIEMEKFLQEKSSHKNLYSFEYRFKELKQIYLDNLSKPKHIMEAIKAYKKSKENEYITVNSSLHLLEIVKDSISNEIRNWIEVEGAYKHISELAKKDTNINAEEFIQKSIKSQIELSLIKKGLRHTDIKIKREEQTLDDKRADFTINYGFIGQVLLELKLSHNSESKSNQKAGREYKEKLIKYIDATNSDYGLFIIFNTKENKVVFERQIGDLVKLYEDKDNVSVLGLNSLQ
ncbi:NACHT domain-containing protein [Aliarcobacter cryaerophilus]|uniref:NACHT domain-containing protein n=1 Tax=Aliarcobacter cryaerophilus TaxID=28198 RepID=UPI0013DF390A|nr:hypothetical protein [Aliarcobacter cryaerophilus]